MDARGGNVDELAAPAHTDVAGIVAPTYAPGSRLDSPAADPSGVSILSWYPRIMRWRRFLTAGACSRKRPCPTCRCSTAATLPRQWCPAVRAKRPLFFLALIADECQELIKQARPKLKRSAVNNAITGEAVSVRVRVHRGCGPGCECAVPHHALWSGMRRVCQHC